MKGAESVRVRRWPVVVSLKLERKGCWRASAGGFCTGSRRAEEKGQRLLLAGLDGIRKAGIVTDGPGVR